MDSSQRLTANEADGHITYAERHRRMPLHAPFLPFSLSLSILSEDLYPPVPDDIRQEACPLCNCEPPPNTYSEGVSLAILRTHKSIRTTENRRPP